MNIDIMIKTLDKGQYCIAINANDLQAPSKCIV